MRSQIPVINQLNFLGNILEELLKPKHELYLLSNALDWNYLETEFSNLYSNKGRLAHPIRLIASLLILKTVYNLSDEKLVEKHLGMNAYFQHFSGKEHQ
jgi:IS5 family transposase